MKEEWRTLIFRGKTYNQIEISNRGKIRNYATKKIYKLFKDQAGYLGCNIFLYYDKRTCKRKQLYFKMHQGVADTFIPNPFNLNTINHKDADKLNNEATNLEWCTPKENSEHASKNGLLKDQTGCSNGYSKLTESDIHYIRANYYYNPGKGSNAKELAKKFNVHPSTITNVVSGKCYKDVI